MRIAPAGYLLLTFGGSAFAQVTVTVIANSGKSIANPQIWSALSGKRTQSEPDPFISLNDSGLPTPAFKSVPVQAADVARSCIGVVDEDLPCASPTAKLVTYDDCTTGTPWLFCRCDNARQSIDEVATIMAQVPIGLRRAVNSTWLYTVRRIQWLT